LEPNLTAELTFFAENNTQWQKSEATRIEKCFSDLKKKAIIFFRKNFDVR